MVVPSVGSIVRELKEADEDAVGLESELERLTKAYRLEPGDFETFLAACSRTHGLEQRVREKLRRAYSTRYPAVLTYEILAHLLKHRYLDAIFTFNFDELLDQSIEDELSAAEYVRVISERDCAGVEFNPSAATYKPLYIKLHGTASDPDTLRFTREAYFSTRAEIDSAVRKILGTEDCTLIVVGSSMKSFEFNLLLDGPKELRVFNLSTLSLDPAVREEILERRESRITTFHDILKPLSHNHNMGRWPAKFDGGDHIMLALSDLVAQRARRHTGGLVSFRPVHRHRLVAQICGGDYERKYRAEYLETRAILELAYSGIKGRGITSIETLAKDRGARYYDLYRDAARTSPLSWRDMCKRAGIVPHKSAQDTYTVDESVRLQDPGFSLDENPAFDLKKLARTLDRNLSHRFERRLPTRRAQLLEAVLATLNEGTEIEIRAADDVVCRKLFRAPELLQMDTALRARSMAMLSRRHYSYLAVVAETGEWMLKSSLRKLLQARIRQNDLQILLIVAFKQKLPELEAAFGPNLRSCQLPWWRHNRHLTLVTRGKTPLEGIHLTRRLRSPFVSPVHLRDTEDLRILEWTFCNYWFESMEYREASSDTSMRLEYEEGLPGLP